MATSVACGWAGAGAVRPETTKNKKKLSLTDGPTDGPTDRWTNGPTDQLTDRPTKRV